MQTFLPFADFKQPAFVLDNKRILKQTVECIQILNTLCGLSQGWQNHPIIKMWKGYESALLEYTITCLDESLSRGIRFTSATQQKIYHFADIIENKEIKYPDWLGNKDFHLSHQSNQPSLCLVLMLVMIFVLDRELEVWHTVLVS